MSVYSTVILGDSPIRYYRMDDTNTTAVDSSTSGKNGTYSGGYTQSVTGLITGDSDTAVTFNGSTGEVTVPTTGLPSGANAWSLEALVQFASNPSTLGIIAWFGASATNESAELFLNTNGKFEVATVGTGATAPSASSTGTHHHVVGTYDGTSLRLYVDGTLVAGPTAASLNIVDTNARIGVLTTTDFANFTIDEVAYYSVALSQTQVTNHHNAMLGIVSLATGTMLGGGVLTSGFCLLMDGTVVGSDSFYSRTASNGFGTASDGKSWTNDGTTNSTHSVSGGQGQVTYDSGSAEWLISGDTSGISFSEAAARFTPFDTSDFFGIVLRWQNGQNYIRAIEDGGSVIIQKIVGGVQTNLGSFSFTITGGSSYWIQFQSQGTTYNARAWADGSAQPTAWGVSVTDNTVPAGGQEGVYMRVGTSGGTQYVDHWFVSAGPLVGSTNPGGGVMNSRIISTNVLLFSAPAKGGGVFGGATAAAIPFVQQIAGSADSANSLALTLPNPPTQGDVLVAAIALNTGASNVTGISQTGVAWAAWQGGYGPGATALLWYGVVGAGASRSMTVSLSAPCGIGANVSEWDGVDLDAPLHVSGAGASGSVSYLDSGNVDAVQNGLAIAVAAVAGQPTVYYPGNQYDALAAASTTNVTLAAAFNNGTAATPTAQYYVDPAAGSDSNPGTSTQPWQTIAHAGTQSLQPGTVVWLRPGTYTEGAININSAGTATARIRFVSTVKWGAVIVSTASSGSAVTLNHDYQSIEGVELYAQTATQGITIGIKTEGNYDRVYQCKVHDLCNFNPGGVGGAGIDSASTTNQSAEIVGNLVYNIAANAAIGVASIHAIYVSGPGGHVESNICYNCQNGWGIHLFHAPYACHTANNLVFNCASGGMVLSSDGTSGPPTDYCLTENNIFRDGGDALEEFNTGSWTGSNNLYVDNDTWNQSNHTYVLIYNGETWQGDPHVDPNFVNFQSDGSGDYHLSSASTLIGAGFAAGAPAMDYAGNNRPGPDGVSIGPYEYNASPGYNTRTVWLTNNTYAQAAVGATLNPGQIAPGSLLNVLLSARATVGGGVNVPALLNSDNIGTCTGTTSALASCTGTTGVIATTIATCVGTTSARASCIGTTTLLAATAGTCTGTTQARAVCVGGTQLVMP